MSHAINTAIDALRARLPEGFAGPAKFVIEGEGAIMVDAAGVRAADEPADVTLTASADTFRDLLAGDLNPTLAFMTGRLSVDGNMGLAMQLGAALS